MSKVKDYELELHTEGNGIHVRAKGIGSGHIIMVKGDGIFRHSGLTLDLPRNSWSAVALEGIKHSLSSDGVVYFGPWAVIRISGNGIARFGMGPCRDFAEDEYHFIGVLP